MWFTDSHLSCKGTTSKSCRAWSSTYQLHVIYRLLINLRSVYPCTHLSLSINLSFIYLSFLSVTCYLSIIFLLCSINLPLSITFLFIYWNLCICMYTFVSTLYVSRHHLSIHLSLLHLSINPLRRITYLSTYLSIHPTTIYHISITCILIYHWSFHRFMC